VAQSTTDLWKHFKKENSLHHKQLLIEQYAYLVKLVAGRLGIYLGSYTELEDLVSYGIIGLIDAIEKFDYTKNVKFETYASLRIRGAILDEIRRLDWVPRSLRKKQKEMMKAYSELENSLGREPKEEEMIEKLQLGENEYQELLQETAIYNLVSIDDYMLQASNIEDTTNELPEKHLEQQELLELLAKAIEELPEREKSVIIFYYYEELTLKEISAILEVSESRVSQLHTKAVSRLRMKMAKYNLIIPL
jgi:RNA polymerase sigma factor for flagellar operon FliA